MRKHLAWILLLAAFIVMTAVNYKQRQAIDKLIVGLTQLDQIIGLCEIQLMACGCSQDPVETEQESSMGTEL